MSSGVAMLERARVDDYRVQWAAVPACALMLRPASAPLGSRLKPRFAGIGLEGDIEELRGEQAQPADFNP
mgnify:CR=1 FL=1